VYGEVLGGDPGLARGVWSDTMTGKGAANVLIYGLDPGVVESLPATRSAKAVVDITLLDADGQEVVSTEFPFTKAYSAGYLQGFLLSANSGTCVRARDWPFIGVWPGSKSGGDSGDHYFAQSWFGNVYADAHPDDIKRVKNMTLSVRWQAK